MAGSFFARPRTGAGGLHFRNAGPGQAPENIGRQDVTNMLYLHKTAMTNMLKGSIAAYS